MKTPEQWIEEIPVTATPSPGYVHEITVEQIAAIQSDDREGMVPRGELEAAEQHVAILRKQIEGMVSKEELQPILIWLWTINTPDVEDFLGQLTSLRMRDIISRLENLLGEKGGK